MASTALKMKVELLGMVLVAPMTRPASQPIYTKGLWLLALSLRALSTLSLYMCLTYKLTYKLKILDQFSPFYYVLNLILGGPSLIPNLVRSHSSLEVTDNLQLIEVCCCCLCLSPPPDCEPGKTRTMSTLFTRMKCLT